MVGEPRRKELMKRLTAAVCGGPSVEQEQQAQEKEYEASVQRELARFAEKTKGSGEKFNDMPSALYRRHLPADDDSDIKPNVKVNTAPPEVPVVEVPTNRKAEGTVGGVVNEENAAKHSSRQFLSDAEANQLKKNIKKLQNRRAVAIANLLSGPAQDPTLKQLEKMLIKADTELSRVNGLAVKSGKQVSSVIIDNGAMMDCDTLLKKLEQLRLDSKQKVCIFGNFAPLKIDWLCPVLCNV
jgi:hypothetical protein